MSAEKLTVPQEQKTRIPVIGVFATGDPRIDSDSRKRCQNIIRSIADQLSGRINLPGGAPVQVVYSDILVDGERQADTVAWQFIDAGVNVLIGVPDTWAFPQLTVFSLYSHFPQDTPLNLTCGNSAPKPGVVFTHAVSGAMAQSGKLMHIIVGKWEDSGLEPEIDQSTIDELINWSYATVTRQYLKGKRVVVFGHDSMGMETALPHVLATRETYGIEITRLDMKLLADMLQKKSYDADELGRLKEWLYRHAGERIQAETEKEKEDLEMSLALYLIVRDLLNDLGAVGGGFMSQLEWGSDFRGIPLPTADIMESLFNSTFDHNGPKAPIPFATEADTQALLTMLFMTTLSGGNPPLFMDFRKVWEKEEVEKLAGELKLNLDDNARWLKNGFVDGNNSGSASFDWAGLPGTTADELMKRISFPRVNNEYFPGGGVSVQFLSPGGIQGIAARLAYSLTAGLFSMVWDEAESVELPNKLAEKVMHLSDYTWPHTFLTPKHATMFEYKHYMPANHLHMTWGLPVSRLQYWMDLTNTLSATPWKDMEYGREGIDRPMPLLYVLNGGENETKLRRCK
ncbi:MAG TPA: hypothetical protein VE912_22815 [Bacteroidales bacterium]|nr:hypothetical protein [Bacteroidales bacterium]